MYIFLWYIAVLHTHTHTYTHCYELKMEPKTQSDFWHVDKAMRDR